MNDDSNKNENNEINKINGTNETNDNVTDSESNNLNENIKKDNDKDLTMEMQVPSEDYKEKKRYSAYVRKR